MLFSSYIAYRLIFAMIRTHYFIIAILFSFIFITCTKEEFIPNDGRQSNRTNDEVSDDENHNEELDSLAWTIDEQAIIFSDDDTVKLRVLYIDNPDDSVVLRSISKNVNADPSDSALSHLIDRMYKTVLDPQNPGVGIAAPQVGINRRIIWVQRYDKSGSPFEVYLNPRIVQVAAPTSSALEGCLSVPNPPAGQPVTRPYGLYLEYTKQNGTDTSEVILHSYTSRIFQHEIDHLDGILYYDYFDSKKSVILNARIENLVKNELYIFPELIKN